MTGIIRIDQDMHEEAPAADPPPGLRTDGLPVPCNL